MISLNLPSYEAKISQKDGKNIIFDDLRRRYVNLSPEEWVRQHFIHFLISYKHYPKNLMANEVTLKLNNMLRRCDTVIYNKDLTPIIIIEYKAPSVKLSQKIFTQISTYNLILKVDYLIVSNGLNHCICKMNYETQSYTFLPDIPDYNDLK